MVQIILFTYIHTYLLTYLTTRETINQQVRRTCDDDVNSTARFAGDITGRTGILSGSSVITLTQLNEDLIPFTTDHHRLVGFQRLSVLEPRYAHVTACTQQST